MAGDANVLETGGKAVQSGRARGYEAAMNIYTHKGVLH